MTCISILNYCKCTWFDFTEKVLKKKILKKNNGLANGLVTWWFGLRSISSIGLNWTSSSARSRVESPASARTWVAPCKRPEIASVDRTPDGPSCCCTDMTKSPRLDACGRRCSRQNVHTCKLHLLWIFVSFKSNLNLASQKTIFYVFDYIKKSECLVIADPNDAEQK